MHIVDSGRFSDKKILLTDKEEKKKNDHTWCFWETTPGLFEPIVYQRWKKVWFYSSYHSELLQLEPYEYKMIRAIDFYKYCFESIRKEKNIDIILGNVQQIESNNAEAFIVVDDKKINASYIFNSILFEKPVLKKNEYYLLQHFKGWFIETEKPVFKPEEAVLMDFRTDQQYGTTFLYVMPFSTTKALIEYTIFSEKILETSQYEAGLKTYIHQFLQPDSYKIMEEELGVIPMTNHRFSAHSNNIINIGTAGGQTKASSGYTFSFIQKHSAAITEELIKTGKPFVPSASKRFSFYDSVLLNILHHNKLPGDQLFSMLFKKNSTKKLLKFLDNESSLADELKIISTLPTLPFLKAALHQF